jgi:hypothetical protein
MREAQDGLCAVCHRSDPEHVDHDHTTGEVRGMLCFNCNQALGNVRDDLVVLRSLIGYLQNFKNEPAPVIPYQEIRFVGLGIAFDPDGSWHRREPLNA